MRLSLCWGGEGLSAYGLRDGREYELFRMIINLPLLIFLLHMKCGIRNTHYNEIGVNQMLGLAM